MEQVIVDDRILEIAMSIEGKEIKYFRNVINWIHSNFQFLRDTKFKSKTFRKRNTAEILESRVLTGCTEYTLIFLALARAKNYKTTYLELFKEIIGSRIEGHVISKVYLNDKIYFVDPIARIIDDKFAYFESKGYKIIAEGKDSWDIGVNSIDDLNKLILDFLNKN